MSIEVPMHTVIKYTPVRGGGWKESQHPLCDLEGLVAGSVHGNGLPHVESASEISALSACDAAEIPASPIWGDHVTAAAMKQAKASVKGGMIDVPEV